MISQRPWPSRVTWDGLRFWRKQLATAGGLFVLLGGVGTTQAADWELLYRLDETLSGSNNITVEQSPDGPAGRSRSSVGVDLKAVDKTWIWSLTGDVGYIHYFGEGAPDTNSVLTTSAFSQLVKQTRDTDYTLSANIRISPASTSELDELGINRQQDVLRLLYGGQGSILHRVNARNQINFYVNADKTDFSETGANLTPSTSAGAGVRWTNRLTRRIDGHLNGSVFWQKQQNASDTESLIYRIALGTDTRVTKRLNVSAEATVAITDQYAIDPLFPLAGRQNEIDVGFEGSLAIDYRLLRDTRIDMLFSQNIAPDGLGDLRQTQVARAALTHEINSLSSLSLSTHFTNSTSTGTDSDSRKTLSVSPRYSYKLAKEWDASLSYRWILADSGTGDRTSHTVFVSLSKIGTLLP